MTSSETPIEPAPTGGNGTSATEPVSAVEPAAAPAPTAAPRAQIPLGLAVTGGVLIVGWLFIAFIHGFHLTVATVVLSIGWLAVVSAAYFVLRTATAAADDAVAVDDWWRPTGARDELEREKKSLLKAMKEIDFDHEMGKMSDADAQELLRVYRSRALAVLKAIDALDSGGPRSVQDEIDRELRARMALSGPGKKTKAKRAPKRGAGADAASEPAASEKENAR